MVHRQKNTYILALIWDDFSLNFADFCIVKPAWFDVGLIKASDSLNK